MIRFEDIPTQYGFCPNTACPSAGTCLRHLAFLILPEERDFPHLLPPRHYPVEGETRCIHYRSNAKVHYARGFREVLKTFPVNVLDAFRDRLTTIYPRNKYYKLRKGALPLSPDEQERIKKIAREKGFPGEFTFDAYEEGYFW